VVKVVMMVTQLMEMDAVITANFNKTLFALEAQVFAL
jgi:hypothetical protein